MDERANRLTVLVAGAVVLGDITLFTALGPILPDLAARYGLTGTEAGLLSASAPLGEFLFAIAAAVMCVRAGPRRALVVGVALTTVASVVFGLDRGGYGILLAARLVQGCGSALSWIGCLTLASDMMPPERRGEAVGLLMSAAAAGTLAGPLLGASADAWGLGPAFITYGVVLAALGAIVATRANAPHVRHDAGVVGLFRALRSGALRRDYTVVLALAGIGGGLMLVTPLALDHRDAGTSVITTVFVAAALASVFLNPMMGKWADRIGARRAVIVGLVCTAVPMAVVAGPEVVVAVLGVALVLSIIANNVAMVPAASGMSATAEDVGIPTAFGFSLMSLAWAPGFSGGSVITGALADVGFRWAFGFLALACVATAILGRWNNSTSTSSSSAPASPVSVAPFTSETSDPTSRS